MAVLWEVVQCCLVEIYLRFRGIYSHEEHDVKEPWNDRLISEYVAK
jgi:hypothetical protein